MQVTIKGTGFQDGATVSFSGEKIDVDDVTYNSATQLIAEIMIWPDAPLGPRDVTVTNPDEEQATLEGAFEVIAAP